MTVNFHSGNSSTLPFDSINFGIEHVGTAVDGAETRERLGKTSETVDRVEERRVSVFALAFDVKHNFFEGRLSGLLEIAIIELHSQCVADEIHGVFTETILFIDS